MPTECSTTRFYKVARGCFAQFLFKRAHIEFQVGNVGTNRVFQGTKCEEGNDFHWLGERRGGGCGPLSLSPSKGHRLEYCGVFERNI